MVQQLKPAPEPGGAGPMEATMRSTVLGHAPEVGTVLGGRYQLQSLIGRGGMGSVFLAKHTQLGKPLAVKVLEASRAGSEAIERLFREARAAAAIGHPNIVDVNDVGFSEAGEPYLVMEYLEGEDLSSYLDRCAPISVAAACGLLEPVLLALGAAHDMGIVHRDLKPANIVIVKRSVSPLTVKLIDFGIAKLVREPRERQLTADGTLLGTPSYMSPEQARGATEIDERADLYAVGVIFYQMVTGRLPFDGRNYNETLYRIVNDPAPDPDMLVSELPADAVDFIQRAIAKDRAERFQSATTMLDALERLRSWDARGEAMLQIACDLQIRSSGQPGAARAHGGAGQGGAARSSGEKRVSPGSDSTLGQAVAKPSPSDSVPRGMSSQPSASAPSARAPETQGPSRATAVLALVSLSLAAALVWNALRSPTEAAGPATAPLGSSPLQPVPERRIQFTVTGTPPEATITYDGRTMSGTQFQVPAGDAPTQLRIEHPGFQAFSTTIVPNKDTRLHVSLLPTSPSAPSPSAVDTEQDARRRDATGLTHTKSGRPNRISAPTSATGSASEAEIHRGTRDTLYTEKFE